MRADCRRPGVQHEELRSLSRNNGSAGDAEPDALGKSGVSAEETVFIDDSVRNLQGAAELGITPILIAANPDADVETDYLKIHDLRELIR